MDAYQGCCVCCRKHRNSGTRCSYSSALCTKIEPTSRTVLETTYMEWGFMGGKSNKRLNQSELFQLIILLFIHTYKYYWCGRMLSIQNNETLVMGWENYALFEYLAPKILIIDKVENAAILRHSLLQFSSNWRNHVVT